MNILEEILNIETYLRVNCSDILDFGIAITNLRFTCNLFLFFLVNYWLIKLVIHLLYANGFVREGHIL